MLLWYILGFMYGPRAYSDNCHLEPPPCSRRFGEHETVDRVASHRRRQGDLSATHVGLLRLAGAAHQRGVGR